MSSLTIGRVIGTAYTWDSFPGAWDDDATANKSWDEAGVMAFSLAVGEDMSLAEVQAVRAVFGLYFSEAFGVSEAKAFRITLGILHALSFGETLQSNSNLAIRGNESLVFSDDPAFTLTKKLAEAFSASDTLAKLLTSAQSEGFAVGEDYERQIDYVRSWLETIVAGEGLAKTVTVSKGEATQILDYFIRNANGVMGDISFFDSAYTETQFKAQAEAAPTGFTEFVPFLAGEHTFSEAIFKSTLAAASTLTRPRMTQLVVAVDVPDVTDQGLMTIQTTGTDIVFAKSFFKVPSVKVVIKSGTDLAIPRISNETTLGFTVKLESVSTPGTFVAGTVSWSAEGY